VTVHGMCKGCQADEEVRDAEREGERRETLWRRAVSPRQLEWSFDTYRATAPDADVAAAAEAAGREWLRRYRAGERLNLFVSGEVGRGKTGLAVAVARELVFGDGLLCYVVNWRNLLQEIQAGFNERYELSVAQRLENYFGVPVLAIDDVGAERPTEWRRDQLATLIEARYGSSLPTIVTSNYALPDLARRLGHDDPVVGQRIVSRLREGAMGIVVEGRDRRTMR
jgi:DNA replication protein DnaC